MSVFLADVDGDGKVDYVIGNTDGSMIAWRNGGAGIPTFWQSLGVIFKDSRGLDVYKFGFVCIILFTPLLAANLFRMIIRKKVN